LCYGKTIMRCLCGRSINPQLSPRCMQSTCNQSGTLRGAHFCLSLVNEWAGQSSEKTNEWWWTWQSAIDVFSLFLNQLRSGRSLARMHKYSKKIREISEGESQTPLMSVIVNRIGVWLTKLVIDWRTCVHRHMKSAISSFFKRHQTINTMMKVIFETVKQTVATFPLDVYWASAQQSRRRKSVNSVLMSDRQAVRVVMLSLQKAIRSSRQALNLVNVAFEGRRHITLIRDSISIWLL
jgi:hypothetical protein